MAMSDELAAAFNDQLTKELAASVSYLQMSAYFEAQNLTGMAGWMHAQSEEERDHALRFMHFILDRGTEVTIGDIDAPSNTFDSAEAVFAAALEQERSVTASIHDLLRQARADGDLASEPFLASFVEEQIEEEASVETILERVRLAAGESSAMLLLDNELGTRRAG